MNDKDMDLAPHHDVPLIDYKPAPLTMLHDSRHYKAQEDKMTDKQPEALLYADRLENYYMNIGRIDAVGAASELRRLHTANRELLETLKLCEGNISSLLAANHPMVFGKWLDVVRSAIAKAGGAA